MAMAEETDDPTKTNRFTEPFGSRCWHSDVTPFSGQDYSDAGRTPPTRKQLEWWESDEYKRLVGQSDQGTTSNS